MLLLEAKMFLNIKYLSSSIERGRKEFRSVSFKIFGCSFKMSNVDL